MGRPRGKPFAALGRGPPVPSAALRPAPGPPLSSFVALGEISAQDSRGRTARQDLGRLQACPPRSGPRWWLGWGCDSEDFSKGDPRPPDPASRILPSSGLRSQGSMVQRALKGRGGTEQASMNNQVSPPHRRGPAGEAPRSPGVPGPRQAAWVWREGVRGVGER